MTTDNPMQIGMVGLGRMGEDIARRLIRYGHRCVVFDVDDDAMERLEKDGATGAGSIADLGDKLSKPREVWVMVPSGDTTGKVIEEAASHMERGDMIIDGGNSCYRDDIARAKSLSGQGVHLVDCGTSGRVWGIDGGYCLMIGGDPKSVEHLEPIFSTIAPGIDSATGTPGRTGDTDSAEHEFLHCGSNGAGHVVKMVHNGIEYGMMAAFSEEFNILANANAGKRKSESDAETAPMEEPQLYQFDIDTTAFAEVWRRRSDIESWLLDPTATTLFESPGLAEYAGRVSDSGEGRWTSIAALEERAPSPLLTTALYSRFASCDLDDFSNKVWSAMQKGFGGHDEKKKKKKVCEGALDD